DIPIEVTENMAPQFDVYTCGNNEVSVQLNDSNYDEYVINYNDASPEAIVNGTGTNHHVYTPGAQTISVRGRDFNADDNCAIRSDIPIEVTENMAPQFDVYTCGNNEVSVQLNDSNYDEYVINYNDASPEAIVNGTGTNHHVYTPGAQTISVRGRDFNADDNCAI